MKPSELHERASALFLELRRLPASEREAALAAATADDAELRAEVASLLVHDVAGEPAWDAVGASDFPARIGPYHVLERIGSGGSGHVFLARQDEPIQRRVAIKVVPQAAFSEELAARFEVERRALERTEHPNVARVLDAGRTADGLPYLVMEYIEGEAITAYCRRRALPLTERIRLLLDVADAVQHVHQRGVVHRDLKPANLLVSEALGRARPHVLDFGIAKATEAFPGGTPATSGLPLGTPSYMAPEQTGLGAVDTRADVYALGAVLYELVSGQPPIEGRGDALELLQRIREEVPPPASRRRADAAARAVPGGRRSFAADLDRILAKALEKRPERRYASVESLADDLRRLLASEPVQARAPTWGYRAACFARRNRVLVGAVAAVVLALAVGVVGLVLGLVEAQRQRLAALEEGDAQREINRFLTEDLLAAASPERDGENMTVLELLNRASERIDLRLAQRPVIAAAVHHTLGEAYAELGTFERAEHHFARALALRRPFLGADAPDTVRTEIAAASLVARRQRYEAAEPGLRQAVTRARLVLGSEDEALYAALNDLGVTLEGVGKHDEAQRSFEEALAGRTRLLGPFDPLVLTTMANLALVHDQRGETERSLELLRAALRAAEASPEQSRTVLLGLHNNLGATLQDLDRDEEAAPYLRRAAELAVAVLGPDHPDTLTVQGNLASLEAELGDPARAIELYGNIVAQKTRILGADAEGTLVARHGYWNSVWKSGRFAEAVAGFEELCPDVADALGERHWLAAQSRAMLARVLLDAGRAEDALALAEEAEADLRGILGPDHPRTRSAGLVVAEIRLRLEGEAQAE